ncbi:MAM domain-containing protein 2-like [Sinocyclocheilus rhinocerous]|uniref:MAM domain-containing protein 2-like n=1 Tax=Sinocyclocheilus rhinocerous TaxID=307959 RepID=UPI0007BA1B59|nr:PREDICTED: MAM domain-containing protein 2-like [Sinocyclocheilus rhinocerous]
MSKNSARVKAWRVNAAVAELPYAICVSGPSHVHSSIPATSAMSLLHFSTLLAVALLVRAQTQLLRGSCSFESDSCGYTSDPAYAAWTINQEGRFIIAESSSFGEKEKYVLVSPELELRDWSCVRLVYQISGSGSLQLHLRPEGENFDYTLWTADKPSDSWLIASVDIRNMSGAYQLLFDAKPRRGMGNSIALFEIHIIPGYCIECNFEEHHLCGYSNQWNPNVNWYVGGSLARDPQSNLPDDHTMNNERGHYMYVDSVYAKRFQEVAKLVSPMTITSMAGCLSFYYQRDQAIGNFFSVFTKDQLGHYDEIWRPDVYATTDWKLVQVDIKAPHPLEMVFEVAFNSPRGGYVALDDISFSPEFCHTETGTVGRFSDTVEDFAQQFSAVQKQEEAIKPILPRRDTAATVSPRGWPPVCSSSKASPLVSTFAPVQAAITPQLVTSSFHRPGPQVAAKPSKRTEKRPWHGQPRDGGDCSFPGGGDGYVGHLFGPSLPGNHKYCLRFYYALHGFMKIDNALALYVYDENNIAQEKIWTVSERSKDVWTEVEVTYLKPMPAKGLFSWPTLVIPLVQGSFLLANTRHTSRPGYVGHLFGPSLPGNHKYCLRFYYALHGFMKIDNALALYVYDENNIAQEKIWTVSERSKDVWTEVEVTYLKPMPAKVAFVSICRNFWDCGLVSLDDISVTLGDCRVTTGPLNPPPGHCNFETGDCGYTQKKKAKKGHWLRIRGHTPTSYTGPKGDHTLGVGYYMYIEASHMLPKQSARLMSTELRGSSGPQCLIFFYHMYGSGTGTLSVLLHKGDRERLLWTRQGEQSVSWMKATVDYECYTRHWIIFEGIRGSSIRSDIAIDEIVFKKGPCNDPGDSISYSGFSENFNEIEY